MSGHSNHVPIVRRLSFNRESKMCIAHSTPISIATNAGLTLSKPPSRCLTKLELGLFSLDIPRILVSINQIMSEGLSKVFEMVSGWKEHSQFEHDHEGYITTERVGEGKAMFLWRVDKEPVHLDHMYMDGNLFVRFSEDYQINL